MKRHHSRLGTSFVREDGIPYKTQLAAPLSFIDLFCGIGGFHLAAKSLGWRCKMASDIDFEARRTYERNFGLEPLGDIHQIEAAAIPDHDILLAGFPCQPFSIIGEGKGFDDARGTLFFEIARIIREKQPRAFVLENVRQLVSHDGGRTLSIILRTLNDLGYKSSWRILNALDFGLPQKRERILIVGSRENIEFKWPSGGIPMKSLAEILEKNVAPKHFASERIVKNRMAAHKSKMSPSIWHENKDGHISSYPFSCALRAGASYNYLLVDGKRRLTPREMLRLQGFPDDFEIVSNDSQTRKQAGNSVAVPVIRAVLENLAAALSPRPSSAKMESATTKTPVA